MLFGSSNAHVDIRQKLIEDNRLDGVISMPSGVFRPYAGVSTAVLFFTKGGRTENIWFYDMEHDGFSLDDKRAPTPSTTRRFRTRGLFLSGWEISGALRGVSRQSRPALHPSCSRDRARPAAAVAADQLKKLGGGRLATQPKLQEKTRGREVLGLKWLPG